MPGRDEIIESAKRANAAAIECWLSWKDRSQEIQLPVTPFPWLVKPKNNQSVNLYDVGDINLPGNHSLKQFSIETFLPHLGNNYGFLSAPFDQDPYLICRYIDQWIEDVHPIRVIFTNTNFDMMMLIDNFEYGEKDRTRDVYIKLDLSEYRHVDAPTKATADATTAENAIAKSQKELKKWTVKYGDTLSGISKAKWGNFDHVKDLIDWNKDLIKTPDSLKAIAGKELNLEKPDDKSAESNAAN